jgi:MarR-like DNA-binding transcriptional regulator SgrR of sgrS sRNA
LTILLLLEILKYSIIRLHLKENISPLNVFSGETLSELPTDLLHQWRDTIGILHCAQLLPDLIDKLFHRCCSESEDSLECNIAALWLNEIAKAVLKLRQIQNILIQSGIKLKEKMNLAKYANYRINLMSGDITSNDSLLGTHEKDAQQQVLKENPYLTTAISLPSSIAAPSPAMFIDIVKKAAFAPNKHSLLYIQRYNNKN